MICNILKNQDYLLWLMLTDRIIRLSIIMYYAT